MSGVVAVRPFAAGDLGAAARFADAARSLDDAIEPFGRTLRLIAEGPRAALHLWRVAAGEDGGVYGIAFCALRAAGSSPVHDFYVAVHPAFRRQGLARALSEPALTSGMTLRARVRDDAFAGRAFAKAAGFVEAGAQLSLQWAGNKIDVAPMPSVRIRAAARGDERALRKLSAEAWVGAPEAYLSCAEEIVQLFAGDARVLLLAESEGKLLGYLAAVELGRTLGIEELAVLPACRRMGVGRALLGRALSGRQGAVLTVAESNAAARALYRSLGFRQTGRRVVMERRA